MKNFPVQNANEQINTNVESVESIHNFIQTKPKYKLTSFILCDAIIFARLSYKLDDILNIFNPNEAEHDFALQNEYSGMCSATMVLKIKDQALDEILGNIWFEMVYNTHTKQNAQECAELMTYRWIKAIKKYNSSYN